MQTAPPQPAPSNWSTTFRAETTAIIQEPFFACLAEAIATVESAAGTRAIHSAINPATTGVNEIGYKAIPGKPSISIPTHEAAPPSTCTTGAPSCDAPKLTSETLAFRLFPNRAEQASLLYLLRTSPYYESARVLFILAFYSAYAPGRTDGITPLLQVFNRLAAAGAYPGVRPLQMLNLHTPPSSRDPDTEALNHSAARAAVHLFAELTQ